MRRAYQVLVVWAWRGVVPYLPIRQVVLEPTSPFTFTKAGIDSRDDDEYSRSDKATKPLKRAKIGLFIILGHEGEYLWRGDLFSRLFLPKALNSPSLLEKLVTLLQEGRCPITTILYARMSIIFFRRTTVSTSGEPGLSSV